MESAESVPLESVSESDSVSDISDTYSLNLFVDTVKFSAICMTTTSMSPFDFHVVEIIIADNAVMGAPEYSNLAVLLQNSLTEEHEGTHQSKRTSIVNNCQIFGISSEMLKM